MPSPFPGMDPYLEDPKLWPEFQHQLVATLFQMLLPNLSDRYRARIACRQYTAEIPLFTSVIRENHQEEYLEIRQRSSQRLITLVEVVSPANRTTAEGRQVYLKQRQQAIAEGAATVEICLVLQGKPTLSYPRDGLPDFDYAVSVTRSGSPERYEIYTTTLQKRLPKFKLPLAPDDRDTLLDLQTAFSRAYDQTFRNAIDYSRPPHPDVPLSDEKRRWINEWLQQQNVR
jgi:hypothetical protein